MHHYIKYFLPSFHLNQMPMDTTIKLCSFLFYYFGLFQGSDIYHGWKSWLIPIFRYLPWMEELAYSNIQIFTMDGRVDLFQYSDIYHGWNSWLIPICRYLPWMEELTYTNIQIFTMDGRVGLYQCSNIYHGWKS